MNSGDIGVVMKSAKQQHKSFVICKRGNSFIPLSLADILILHHHAGVNFAVDRLGNKYVVTIPLGTLQQLLDNRVFFRVNRKMILSIHSIKEFKPIAFGKISIELKHQSWYKDDIIVSQVNSPAFKNWIHSL
jgi:DNA-binding LytR/AlgR family response regulator